MNDDIRMIDHVNNDDKSITDETLKAMVEIGWLERKTIGGEPMVRITPEGTSTALTCMAHFYETISQPKGGHE